MLQSNIKYNAYHQFSPFRRQTILNMDDNTSGLADKIATHCVGLLMDLTVNLYAWHEEKEKTRKMKAQLKAIATKHKQKQSNAQMEARLAQQDREDREAVTAGKMPPSMMRDFEKQMKSDFKKLEQDLRSKSLGGPKNHRQRPIKNGTKPGKPSDESKEDSDKNSQRQRQRQKETSRRKELTGNRGRGRGQRTAPKTTLRDDTNNSTKSSNRNSNNQTRAGRGRGRGGRGGHNNAGRGGRGSRN